MDYNDIIDELNEVNSIAYAIIFLLICFCLMALNEKMNVFYFICISFFFIVLISGNSEAYTYDYDGEIVEINENRYGESFHECDIYINTSIDLFECIIDDSTIHANANYDYDNWSNSNNTEIIAYGTIKTIYSKSGTYIFKNVTFSGSNINWYMADSDYIYLDNFTSPYNVLFSLNDGIVFLNNVTYPLNNLYMDSDSYTNDYDIFRNELIEIYTNCDYLLIANDTYGFSYNCSSILNYNFTISHLSYNTVIEYDCVKYNVTGYINDIEVLNLSLRHFNEYNSFIAQIQITLTLNLYNSLGNPQNNVEVTITNNDTNTGYYIHCDGLNNIVNVTSGELWFLCAANSTNIELKTFELTLNTNTVIDIYLNLTDTIDYDRALIDYEREQNEQMYLRIFAYVFVVIILFTIIVYTLYKVIVVVN